MKLILILLLIPVLTGAQEFEFQQEYDTIPVEINGWHPYQPWVGGISESAPAIVDIDTDDDLDLFTGEFSGDIQYYQNQGTAIVPNFKLITLLYDSIYLSESRSQPCFRDLDADGDLDLVAGDIDGWVYFYRNVGTIHNPDFVLETNTLVPQGPPWCLAPELVDIDSDGDLDLFGGWQNLTFYRNIGTPQTYNFVLTSSSFAGVMVSGNASPEFVDIDADGDFDLFVGNEAGKIWFCRNDGTAWQDSFNYVTNFYNGIDVGGDASPEFADIDADGDYDLFVGREQTGSSIDPGDIFYYENIGTPQVAQWRLVTKNYLAIDVGYTARLTMTDIDADLDLDIFLQHTGDRLSFYQNTGTPDSAAYTWVTDSYQDISVNDAHPEFGDIDADQDPDLLMGEASIPGPPSLYLFQNQGTPQAATFTLFSSNYLPGVFTQSTVYLSPTLSDVDSDGDLDLFIAVGNNYYYYFQNTGTPQSPYFINASAQWQGIGGETATSCYYDIDEDGDLDLFMTRWNGWNQVWFYRNTGTAQNPNMVLQTTTFFGDSLPLLYSGIEIVDIDADGDGDFFLAGCEGGMMFFRNVTGQSPVDPRKRPVPTYPTLDLTLQPNPGNPVAIVLSLPSPQPATLAVYNLLGAKIATLTSGFQPAGVQRYFWETTPFASGVYLVRLEARMGAYAPGGETITKKLTVIK